MKQRKVVKSVEITVNLGNYQNIKLHSGVEKDISYNSDEERVGLEAEVWQELCEDLNAGLRNSLADLGKKTDAPAVFARSCQEKLEGPPSNGS